MIARIYLTQGDKDKAKQHLTIATGECDEQTDAMMLDAQLLYEEGKRKEVIDIISKIKSYINDPVAFEKQCRSSFPNIVNEEGFKNLFGDK
jgi:succinate dehydrogenase/fumarate reductase-like Fe-S protein